MPSNIVTPTKVVRRSGRSTCVVIQMRPDRYSVGFLNVDETVARFPWDWDEEDKETALRIADDYGRGRYTHQEITDMGWYEMPYPIKRK